MKYFDTYNHLKKIINFADDEIIINDDLVIRNYSFSSNHRAILPGGDENKDNYEFLPTEGKQKYEPDVIQEMLNKKDSEILENIQFRYHVMSPRKEKRSKGIILMFHGFNEKSWNKYLPWAQFLVEQTGKSIVMFPIAFHMNRAPEGWTNPREMHAISMQRKKRHTHVIDSSLSNVAISTRLHNRPQRFIWSGLQSYYDMIDLIGTIKNNDHLGIMPTASIDIFSYSIGTFLAEITMMTNENGYFSNAKLASFCGGAVFNRLFPVSRFILDSEANVSLYSYIVEHLDSHIKRDKTLESYLGGSRPEGVNFRSMLNYKSFTLDREQKLRAMSNRIYAVTLVNDSVVPPYEVINTLQGIKRDIPIRVDIEDFPYPYKHEDPFPHNNALSDVIDIEFNRIFSSIAKFLSN